MRPKKVSISDLTEKVTFYIPQGTRDAIGGFSQTDAELIKVWANVQAKNKDRQDSQGGLEYCQEFTVKIRPVNVDGTDVIKIRGIKCGILSIAKKQTFYEIKATAI